MTKITASTSGERIDSFLAKNLAGNPQPPSRSKVQQWLAAQRVWVNGVNVKANYIVQENDEITFDPLPPPVSELLPAAIPLDIFYEDEDLIVVNKAAGMVVHPGSGNPDGTLVNALLHHSNPQGGRASERPGIVHRIDKNTSGLLVVAKSEFAHAKLTEQFQARQIDRQYLALAWGEIPQDGDWHGALGRDPHHRQRMAVVDSGGKLAHTHFQRLACWEKVFSLYIAKLYTGRTHQIRVHSSYAGFPLIGDSTYRSSQRYASERARNGLQKLQKNRPDLAQIVSNLEKQGRQFLHARTLGFSHPRDGRKLYFQAPIPADLNALFQRLPEWNAFLCI
jgi:23S rRNA pseudouridine1911/1915/1917 synthase